MKNLNSYINEIIQRDLKSKRQKDIYNSLKNNDNKINLSLGRLVQGGWIAKDIDTLIYFQ